MTNIISAITFASFIAFVLHRLIEAMPKERKTSPMSIFTEILNVLTGGAPFFRHVQKPPARQSTVVVANVYPHEYTTEHSIGNFSSQWRPMSLNNRIPPQTWRTDLEQNQTGHDTHYDERVVRNYVADDEKTKGKMNCWLVIKAAVYPKQFDFDRAVKQNQYYKVMKYWIPNTIEWRKYRRSIFQSDADLIQQDLYSVDLQDIEIWSHCPLLHLRIDQGEYP